MPTWSGFQPYIQIAQEGINVDSVDKPYIVRVHFKVSKCNQFWNGIDIFLCCIESPMCPVAVHYHTWQSMVQHQVLSVIFKIAALS